MFLKPPGLFESSPFSDFYCHGIESSIPLSKENALRNGKDGAWRSNFLSSDSMYLLESLLHLNNLDQPHLPPQTHFPGALFKHSQG